MSLPLLLLDLSPPPILSRQSKPVLETLPSFFFNCITRPEIVLTPKSVVSFNFFGKTVLEEQNPGMLLRPVKNAIIQNNVPFLWSYQTNLFYPILFPPQNK